MDAKLPFYKVSFEFVCPLAYTVSDFSKLLLMWEQRKQWDTYTKVLTYTRFSDGPDSTDGASGASDIEVQYMV